MGWLLVGLCVVTTGANETWQLFQSHDVQVQSNSLDDLVAQAQKQQGLRPAPLCSDAVFVRRVYLDVIGTLPEAAAVRRFLKDESVDKRSRLIESVLKHEAFADYWALKWCDLLRVKAEFPINLWPNAVQAYHRWIHEALQENMPYDTMARELLTASGSNFRVPQVNFYRAIQGQEPSTIASAVALTFMGVRFDLWPAERRQGMEAFFARVGYKQTAEWKEEIIYLDPAPMDNPRAMFPDLRSVSLKSNEDPRKVFADWLITDINPWFAKNMVNRMWAWLLGRGIIHEPDDIRPDNPPIFPEVLAFLEKELVESDYDLHQLYRLILNSRTYQQSSIPEGDPGKAEKWFACYPVRRLEAEVLIDALCMISGTREKYSSPIPEPFTFIPEDQRTIELADGSITSQFLEMFGRPSRDTGKFSERVNEPTDSQRLHLLNSTHIQNKIERSGRIKNLVKSARGKPEKTIEVLYLHILSRYPTAEELEVAQAYFKTKGMSSNLATYDLSWALINSKEFLYRH